jgi:hypothetical protein
LHALRLSPADALRALESPQPLRAPRRAAKRVRANRAVRSAGRWYAGC